ncbi:hypothetical protein HMPREF9074_08688 [Capnocytophaga sp. oral taxon 329 str. F0087]|nr:hypothetical protein HMPREF9074_08688 [Capnocytophaga sp. oral taxon 329 str. F0087]
MSICQFVNYLLLIVRLLFAHRSFIVRSSFGVSIYKKYGRTGRAGRIGKAGKNEQTFVCLT